MATEKLDISQTIKDGFNLGLKKFFPFLLTVLLYLVTCWIPYLNIGTTIGLYKIIIALGRDEKIDPISLFDKENFKPMGGFFLLLGLQMMGLTLAFICLFIPGIVLGIAWGFAMFFFLDKKTSPVKALQLSFDATYGNKWRIFFTGLLCGLILAVVGGLLMLIPKVGMVLYVIAMILWFVIYYAIYSVMYDFFSKKADAIIAERHRHFPGKGPHGPCCAGEAPADAPAAEPVVEEPVVEEPKDVTPEADPFADVKTEA